MRKLWIKHNNDKYPLAKNKNGRTLQHLSAFGEETMKADAYAFKALMKHIREFDEKEQTVIMAQIENDHRYRLGSFRSVYSHDALERRPAALCW